MPQDETAQNHNHAAILRQAAPVVDGRREITLALTRAIQEAIAARVARCRPHQNGRERRAITVRRLVVCPASTASGLSEAKEA